MIAELADTDYNCILVVNALNGMLPLALRDSFPSSRIVCGEVFPFFKEHLTNLGFEVVDWDDLGDMKFDLVIGNPPYQNTHDAKRWPLWHDFVIQSADLSRRFVSLVTPNSWIGAGSSPAKSTILKYVVSCDLTVSKHFEVGSTFSAFVLDLETTSSTFKLVTDKGEFEVPRTLDWLPNEVTEHSLSINAKFFGTGHKFDFKRGECHTSNKNLFAKEGHEVFHTNAQTLYYKSAPPNFENAKVAISLSGYPRAKVGKNFGVSQAAAYVCIDDPHLDHVQSVFDSRLFGYILSVNKWSGWNSLDVIKALPKIDLTRSWTDTELYAHFGLTPDEIAYVEQRQNPG